MSATSKVAIILLICVSYANAKICTCKDGTKEITMDDGKFEFFSPGWPFDYCDNSICTWTLKAPSSYGIQVAFDHFDTELNHDFLELFDGEVAAEEKLMTKCSGRSCDVPQSQSGAMTIRFTSDGALGRGGFRAYAIASAYHYEYHMMKYILFLTAILCLLAATMACCMWPSGERPRQRIIIKRRPELLPIIIPITVSGTPSAPNHLPNYETMTKDGPPPYAASAAVAHNQNENVALF